MPWNPESKLPGVPTRRCQGPDLVRDPEPGLGPPHAFQAGCVRGRGFRSLPGYCPENDPAKTPSTDSRHACFVWLRPLLRFEPFFQLLDHAPPTPRLCTNLAAGAG